MKTSKKLTLAIILLLAFIILSINVALKTSPIKLFDNFFISEIYHHSTWSLNLFRGITFLGNTNQTIAIVVAFSIILLWKRYYYAMFFLIINKILVTSINTTIKYLVERERPSHHHFVYAGGFSYPSGHSASAFALYISLLIIAWFVFKNIKLRVLIGITCLSFVLLIGYSRIFLGVHYPSDVLGGYLLAATIMSFTTILFTKDSTVLNLKGIDHQSNKQ
ncbi:phosphatase PAP2 family protein [Companilactobacillus baiquanensis]|uniref:Phosphatase PAP2 family protein n=1 Tax=Companilactobacillus baiquanensis TaxID=2486005 RepID=A0ABW1UVM4_9LACO|nr:phosphatase PAP2 family protein [Companilactobacillus baiquanensis]